MAYHDKLLNVKGDWNSLFIFLLKITWACVLGSGWKLIFHWCTHLLVSFKSLLSLVAKLNSMVGRTTGAGACHVGMFEGQWYAWWSFDCTNVFKCDCMRAWWGCLVKGKHSMRGVFVGLYWDRLEKRHD